MAVPRVFVSSTYYDLKQVRNNIGAFIMSLGYEPVMHERSGVAYTQNKPLESDCYHELASCDIVVCIIGNHFGSKSSNNELSITMNEIKTAIKSKKKMYIFIARDVYTENRTYEQNKDSGLFKSAYTDDLKIHEFILDIKNNAHYVISSFDTTDEIIGTLRLQFAGLFQYLLARDASVTEAKTTYDLQETSDTIRALISEFKTEKDEFFHKFDSTVFAINLTARAILNRLKINKFKVFIDDLSGLDELLTNMGFAIEEVDDELFDCRKYVRNVDGRIIQTLILKDDLIDSDGRFKDIRNLKLIDKNIVWKSEVCQDDDLELPF